MDLGHMCTSDIFRTAICPSDFVLTDKCGPETEGYLVRFDETEICYHIVNERVRFAQEVPEFDEKNIKFSSKKVIGKYPFQLQRGDRVDFIFNLSAKNLEEFHEIRLTQKDFCPLIIWIYKKKNADTITVRFGREWEDQQDEQKNNEIKEIAIDHITHLGLITLANHVKVYINSQHFYDKEYSFEFSEIDGFKALVPGFEKQIIAPLKDVTVFQNAKAAEKHCVDTYGGHLLSLDSDKELEFLHHLQYDVLAAKSHLAFDLLGINVVDKANFTDGTDPEYMIDKFNTSESETSEENQCFAVAWKGTEARLKTLHCGDKLVTFMCKTARRTTSLSASLSASLSTQPTTTTETVKPSVPNSGILLARPKHPPALLVILLAGCGFIFILALFVFVYRRSTATPLFMPAYDVVEPGAYSDAVYRGGTVMQDSVARTPSYDPQKTAENALNESWSIRM